MSGEEPTHDTASRDLAFLLSTSGAGGGPYGVEHTHGGAFAARAQAEHWLDARPGDVVWCTADTSSPLAVWLLLLGPWARGAEIVLHQGAFDPEERLDLIRRFEVTVLCQSPARVPGARRDGRAGRSPATVPDRLRRMVSTGDFLSSDVVVRLRARLGHARRGRLGADGVRRRRSATARMTASTTARSGTRFPATRSRSSTRAAASSRRAARESSRCVGGRPRSSPATGTRRRRPAAVFRGDLYMTGDLAVRDEDGSVRLLGRATDVVTSGGRRFSPFEVEQALARAPRPSRMRASSASAISSAAASTSARSSCSQPGVAGSDRLVAEIRQHLRHTLPEDKVPREVEFVDALPTAPNGTILRNELRDWTMVAAEGVWSTAPRLPGTPAPVTTFEPPPEPRRQAAPTAEDEEPLPDFVVHPSQTYATSPLDLEDEPDVELEPTTRSCPTTSSCRSSSRSRCRSTSSSS